MKNTILFLLMFGNVSFGQNIGSQSSVQEKFIYAITVKHKKEDKTAILMTGIKVKGYDGIFTALHGLLSIKDENGDFIGSITATRIIVVNNQLKEENKIGNLVVKLINVEKDIAMLGLEGEKKPLNSLKNNQFLGVNEGFEIVESSSINNNVTTLEVCGYPAKFPQTKNIKTIEPYILKLGSLIHGLKFNDNEQLKNQVQLNQLVVQLEPDIFQGHSGAPLIIEGNKIIGVSNGGYQNSDKKVVFTWGILWDKKLKVGEKVKKIEDALEHFKYSSLDTISDNSQLKSYNLFDYPKVSPNWILGGTISKSYAIDAQTTGTSVDRANLSGYANFFIERKITKWLMVGGYASSNFIQYKILKSSLGLSNSLNIPEITAQNNNILYGLQMSLPVIRGVLYQVYIGGGAGRTVGVISNNFIHNYRGYLGFRHYLWHQQYFSLDFKAMYLRQLETIPVRRPFGNPTFDNLNQLHLCLGINFSLGSAN